MAHASDAASSAAAAMATMHPAARRPCDEAPYSSLTIPADASPPRASSAATTNATHASALMATPRVLYLQSPLPTPSPPAVAMHGVNDYFAIPATSAAAVPATTSATVAPTLMPLPGAPPALVLHPADAAKLMSMGLGYVSGLPQPQQPQQQAQTQQQAQQAQHALHQQQQQQQQQQQHAHLLPAGSAAPMLPPTPTTANVGAPSLAHRFHPHLVVSRPLGDHLPATVPFPHGMPGIPLPLGLPGAPLTTDFPPYQIRILGIPPTGAKSRVETQIKLCLQLVSPTGELVTRYQQVRLPDILIANERWRRHGASRASPSSSSTESGNGAAPATAAIEPDVLTLHGTVICASDPKRVVTVCHGCVQREAKRAQRKKSAAATSSPLPSPPGSAASSPAATAATSARGGRRSSQPSSSNDAPPSSDIVMSERKVLLINAPPIMDFSSGDVILPTRIPCYCRHHREKTGFLILFELRNRDGVVVARGASAPILITDDHKSVNKLKRQQQQAQAQSAEAMVTQTTGAAVPTSAASSVSATPAVESVPTTAAASPVETEFPTGVPVSSSLVPARKRSLAESVTTDFSAPQSAVSLPAIPDQQALFAPLGSPSDHGMAMALPPWPAHEYLDPSITVGLSLGTVPVLQAASATNALATLSPPPTASTTSSRSSSTGTSASSPELGPYEMEGISHDPSRASGPGAAASQFLKTDLFPNGLSALTGTDEVLSLEQYLEWDDPQPARKRARGEFPAPILPTSTTPTADLSLTSAPLPPPSSFVFDPSSSDAFAAAAAGNATSFKLTLPPPMRLPSITSAPVALSVPAMTMPNDPPMAATTTSAEALMAAAVSSAPGLALTGPLSQLPRIDRVVPAEGPLHGGIDVTILGCGFNESLTVQFGNVPALSTTYWSVNTLVCKVPPGTHPGPVTVTIKQVDDLGLSGPDPAHFTYKDGGDKSVLELALSLIGYNLSGKVDPAHAVAARIVATYSAFGGALPAGGSSSSASADGAAAQHCANAWHHATTAGDVSVEETVLAALTSGGTTAQARGEEPGAAEVRAALAHAAVKYRMPALLTWLVGVEGGVGADVRDADGRTLREAVAGMQWHEGMAVLDQAVERGVQAVSSASSASGQVALGRDGSNELVNNDAACAVDPSVEHGKVIETTKSTDLDTKHVDRPTKPVSTPSSSSSSSSSSAKAATLPPLPTSTVAPVASPLSLTGWNIHARLETFFQAPLTVWIMRAFVLISLLAAVIAHLTTSAVETTLSAGWDSATRVWGGAAPAWLDFAALAEMEGAAVAAAEAEASPVAKRGVVEAVTRWWVDEVVVVTAAAAGASEGEEGVEAAAEEGETAWQLGRSWRLYVS
ncbi:hypothetical protein GGF31_008736 [Allomyces arbusculus]|nr:hypothetical protein GGF31_008736 [Allomyces arbusculus]